MPGRAVLVVVAKLDETLTERVEALQGIGGGLLRAKILHCGKIMACGANVRDEARIAKERNGREDDPEQGQEGERGEEDSFSEVAAGAFAAGAECGAILKKDVAENVTKENT